MTRVEQIHFLPDEQRKMRIAQWERLLQEDPDRAFSALSKCATSATGLFPKEAFRNSVSDCKVILKRMCERVLSTISHFPPQERIFADISDRHAVFSVICNFLVGLEQDERRLREKSILQAQLEEYHLRAAHKRDAAIATLCEGLDAARALSLVPTVEFIENTLAELEREREELNSCIVFFQKDRDTVYDFCQRILPGFRSRAERDADFADMGKRCEPTAVLRLMEELRAALSDTVSKLMID